MSGIAYSKAALRELRRMSPAMVHEIRECIAKSMSEQQVSPSHLAQAFTWLEGEGWRATHNAEGTVLVVMRRAVSFLSAHESV